jgi:hypothetical protein
MPFIVRGNITQGPPIEERQQLYFDKVVDTQLAELKNTPDGQRNEQLNKAAFCIAQISHIAQVDPAYISANLCAIAQENGLHMTEARATIKSGLSAGLAQPYTPAHFRNGKDHHPPPPKEDEDAAAIDRAHALWAEARDELSVIAQAYLTNRHIDLAQEWRDIRWHEKKNAIAFKLGDDAVQLVILDSQGKRKAKLSYGRIHGGWKQLGRPDAEDITYFAEGPEEAMTVWQLTGCDVIACAGQNFHHCLHQAETRTAAVILDHKTGQSAIDKAEMAAVAAHKAFKTIPAPTGYEDWNDALCALNGDLGKVAKMFHDLDAAADPTHFHPVWAADLQPLDVPWLIEGLIPARGFMSLYGQPGSFKSFVALYLASAVATGTPVFERPITGSGPVVYICAEGVAGLWSRQTALTQTYPEFAGARVLFFQTGMDLRSSDADAKLLINDIQTMLGEESPALIIADTLNRVFGGGNENSSEDMSSLIKNVTIIQQAFECTMLLVHHSGKDVTRGLRGHSSLQGAVDTILECERIGSDDKRYVNILLAKQKDGIDHITIQAKLTLVDLGEDRSSLVVEPLEEGETLETNKSQRPPPRGANQRVALRVLRELLNTDGISSPGFNDMPTAGRVAKVDDWRRHTLAKMPQDNAAARFNEALMGLQAGEWIGVGGGGQYAWIME